MQLDVYCVTMYLPFRRDSKMTILIVHMLILYRHGLPWRVSKSEYEGTLVAKFHILLLYYSVQ